MPQMLREFDLRHDRPLNLGRAKRCDFTTDSPSVATDLTGRPDDAENQGMSSMLSPMRIGPIEVAFPVVQAARSGYSDWPMRMISRRLGAEYGIHEVMLDQFVLAVKQRRRTRHLLLTSDDEHPVAGQLMGADPEQFAPAALRLLEAGYDVIDINFGCPVKKVVGKCRGGFHLSQPDVALEIVSRVRDAVPASVPVTVKMRQGIDQGHESRYKFFRILDGAFDRGVAAVTVHGRTVEQRYIGPSNWDFLREVKRHAGSRTVLGSGDLFSAEACLEMIRYCGLDGVTVARGSIGNPWIFAQTKALAAGLPLPDPPSVFEQREVIGEHYRLAEEAYGADRVCVPMRKFGIKYARLHPLGEQVRDAWVKVKNAGDWRDVLERWYSEDLPGRYPKVDEVNPVQLAATN